MTNTQNILNKEQLADIKLICKKYKLAYKHNGKISFDGFPIVEFYGDKKQLQKAVRYFYDDKSLDIEDYVEENENGFYIELDIAGY